MRYPRICSLCSALLVFAVSACNEATVVEPTQKYLSGVLDVDMNIYVEYGKTYHMTPYGVWHPEVSMRLDGTIPDSLSYLYVNPFTKDTVRTKTIGVDSVDKDPSADLTITKDSLGTYVVTWYARAEGYYSRSCTKSIIEVSEKSITGFVKYPEDGELEVSGRKYRTAAVGGKEWMRENLADPVRGGTPYAESAAMTDLMGLYYTWDEAASACPPGWKLPSSADWDAVGADGNVKSVLAPIAFNGNQMWEYHYAIGEINDNTHLSIIPAGYMKISGSKKSFSGLGERAVFWTSDVKPDDSGMGIAKYFLDDSNNVGECYFPKSEIGAAVRCVFSGQ